MKVLEVMGQGYIPEYTRTELTDAIHEIHTDYQFISSEYMKKNYQTDKTKNNVRKKISKRNSRETLIFQCFSGVFPF